VSDRKPPVGTLACHVPLWSSYARKKECGVYLNLISSVGTKPSPRATIRSFGRDDVDFSPLLAILCLTAKRDGQLFFFC
jgi:hypothetical protein